MSDESYQAAKRALRRLDEDSIGRFLLEYVRTNLFRDTPGEAPVDYEVLEKAVRWAHASDLPELVELAKEVERRIRFKEPRWLKLKKTFGISAERSKKIDKFWTNWRTPSGTSSVNLLNAIGIELGLDVEDLWPEIPWLYYLNRGDPYEDTLVFDARSRRILFACYGNYVERYT